MKINPMAVADIQAKPPREFKRYEPPKGVIPENLHSAYLAMDSCDYGALNDAYSAGYAYGNLDSFPGYPYLAMMAQKPEYRKMVGTIAEEMTRKWIKLKTVGDEDKSERVKQLYDALDKFHVRDSSVKQQSMTATSAVDRFISMSRHLKTSLHGLTRYRASIKAVP
jgi:hypothetical protein